jgi:hypothetical protein
MTEIGVQFSISNAPFQVVTKATTPRRRKIPITTAHGNLFNHQQRSQQMQYTAVLPVISLSSMSDCKEKFIRMAANNKSTRQTTAPSPSPTEFRLKFPPPDMSQTKLRSSMSNRTMVSNMPKSSLSYPTIISRPSTPHRFNYQQQQQQQQQQLGARFLYVVNTPLVPHRAASARISNNSLSPLPLHQQPHLLTSPLLPRPHPQYGHFLAYLRRQSLARMRRKQQQQQQDEEGNIDNVETAVTLNSTRPPSQLFQSTSNMSFCTTTSPETTSMPTIPLPLKRKTRPLSSYRQLQRASSSLPLNYRLNLNQSPPLKPPSSPRTPSKQPSIEQSSLFTPTNSVVDEKILAPTKKAPYELQLSGDMLNYCYVSDSGVKYQGQLLSTPV